MSSHEEIHHISSSSSSSPHFAYTPVSGFTPTPTGPPQEKRGKSLFRLFSPAKNTGYSPKSKRTCSSIEFRGTVTQSDDPRIDEIHRNQRDSLNIQRGMAWEQRRQGEQLNFITKHVLKLCGHSPTKDSIHTRNPYRREESSTPAPSWTPWPAEKYEPNSWDRQQEESSEPSEH